MMDIDNLTASQEWFLIKYYPSVYFKIQRHEDVQITEDILTEYQNWCYNDVSARDYQPGGTYYYEK